ncbi:MAG: BMP family protein [Bacillota bacterium]
MKRFTVIMLCILLVATALVGCTKKEQPLQKKAALLISGPANDGGWNQLAYEGLTTLRDKMGFQIAVTENVKQADHAQLMRNYANQGFKYVIAHGYEYGDALDLVAKEFPKVTFIQIGGVAKNDKNVNAVLFTSAEAGYITGVLAALMTKSNKLGLVGAVDIPSIKADFQGFKKAVKDFNPAATVVEAWTGSWTDIAKGKEAALAQMATGVDVIMANGDAANHGAAEAVRGTKVLYIGWSRDQKEYAPDSHMVSNVQSVANILVNLVERGEKGDLKGALYIMGYKEGAQYLSEYGAMVPADVRAKVNKVVEDIKAGKITDFGTK